MKSRGCEAPKNLPRFGTAKQLQESGLGLSTIFRSRLNLLQLSISAGNKRKKKDNSSRKGRINPAHGSDICGTEHVSATNVHLQFVAFTTRTPAHALWKNISQNSDPSNRNKCGRNVCCALLKIQPTVVEDTNTATMICNWITMQMQNIKYTSQKQKITPQNTKLTRNWIVSAAHVLSKRALVFEQVFEQQFILHED